MSEAELDSPRRNNKALQELRERGYQRINMNEPKRNPISTLDDAVLWLADKYGQVSFAGQFVMVSDGVVTTQYLIGNNGFDARGALMMATRELWEQENA